MLDGVAEVNGVDIAVVLNETDELTMAARYARLLLAVERQEEQGK